MATSDFFLFVSHVAEDRAAAIEIVDELERRGTRCWIAPRDVRPGEPFDDEIADAIDACRGMVLIFSDLCNDSEYIRREVTVAGESHKPVIPFRIEDVQPRRGLRVRLSDLHWIDGFTFRERAIDEVIKKFAPSKNGPAASPLSDDGRQPAVQTESLEPVDAVPEPPPLIVETTDESPLAGDAQNAKARLIARDEAHGRAMPSDDPALLKSFLNSYPTGSRADEIRERLRRLEPPKPEADEGKRDKGVNASNFRQAITAAFSNASNFSGRSGRSEYWYWVGFVVMGTIAAGIAIPLLGSIFILVTLLPSLAVAARRLHDIDRTGWWVLLWFTGIGSFVVLYWGCCSGTPGPNRFGPDPFATGPPLEYPT
jgi:uncharacterized membrane protein YhaH (DUF805 family)